ncbi:MAG: hypothetical protein FWC43_08925 [Planctomycetaceae bacterium]|nr:hypothetical protein [Planctomycetaceae bacterium]
MQTISINLPDSLGDFVRRQSAEQGIDEYFEKILRLQQREEARDRLEAELIKGIESGFGEPITPEYWQRMREKSQQRLTEKQKSNNELSACSVGQAMLANS